MSEYVYLRADGDRTEHAPLKDGCPNPWHSTSPGRMALVCPECTTTPCPTDGTPLCENPKRAGNPVGHTSGTCYARYVELYYEYDCGEFLMSYEQWRATVHAEPRFPDGTPGYEWAERDHP